MTELLIILSIIINISLVVMVIAFKNYADQQVSIAYFYESLLRSWQNANTQKLRLKHQRREKKLSKQKTT